MTKNKKIEDRIKEIEKGLEWFESEEFNLDEAQEKYDELKKLSEGVLEDIKSLKNKINEK